MELYLGDEFPKIKNKKKSKEISRFSVNNSELNQLTYLMLQ
jgi:hypothetical protein